MALRRRKIVCRSAVTLACAASACVFAACRIPRLTAAESAKTADVQETVVLGVVKDSSGRPVEGASVCFVGLRILAEIRPDSNFKTLGSVSTNREGKFQWRWRRPIEQRWISVVPVARARDQSLGWAKSCKVDQTADVTLSLETTRELHGRLLDASGAPIEGARLRLRSLGRGNREQVQRDGCTIPDAFRAAYTATTDRAGDFAIENLPSSVGHVTSDVESSEYGNPTVTWNVEAPSTLRLERAGRIRGRIDPVPSAQSLDGIRARICRSFSKEPNSQLPYSVNFSARVPISTDGSFEFNGVPPGSYELFATIDPSVAWVPERANLARVQLTAGMQAAELVVTVHPAVAVRGRVVEKQGGRAVGAACVVVYEPAGQFRSKTVWNETATFTDDLGRFKVYLRAGDVFVRATRYPELAWPGFSPPEG
jgi:hypothetical protein